MVIRLRPCVTWVHLFPPECEVVKEERDAFEEEMKQTDECDIENFSTLDNSEKTIAILGDRWPQKVTQEADKVSKNILRSIKIS